MTKPFNDMKIIAATILIALVVVLVGKSIIKQNKAKNKTDSNPYQYDLSEFTKVPSEAIGYDEINTIQIKSGKLHALAIDSKDRVYVASDKYLLIFDTAGDELFRIKLPDSPNCLAVDENGKVYLGMENHVVVYNADLKRKSEWPQISPNSIITSIAVSSNRVFVADAGMFAVYCFDKLGSRIWKTEKGSADKNFRGFVIPSPYFDLALDSDGYLWVVNPGKHEFCSFNSAGTLRSSWHNTSISLQGFSGCCNPTHFAFLSDDSIVTSEKGIVRVKVHGPSGAFSTVVASPAKFSEDTVGLDLAVDSKQNIWILDPYTSTLRIFAKKE